MKKKVDEGFGDNRINIDLSKKDDAAAKIIRDNSELFKELADAKGHSLTKADVIDLCHKLFDEAKLDTPWSRVFFINLDRMGSGEQALQYVYNAMLKGAGLGVIGRRRMYEEDDEIEKLDVEDFKKKLKAGEVKFKYTKKDGSKREAKGTLKVELMDLPEKIKNPDVDKASDNMKKKKKLPADSVFYYDLDSKGFRSFKVGNFVKYL